MVVTSGILFGQGIVQMNLEERGVIPNTLYEIECWVFIDTSEITPASVHLQLNQDSIAGMCACSARWTYIYISYIYQYIRVYVCVFVCQHS